MSNEGCPNLQCRRKVERRDLGGEEYVYYCSKCTISHQRFEPGVYITFYMRDFSRGRLVTIFNMQVEELHHTTPLGLIQLKQSSTGDEFQKFIYKHTFKHFMWLLRVDRNLFNGMYRLFGQIFFEFPHWGVHSLGVTHVPGGKMAPTRGL